MFDIEKCRKSREQEEEFLFTNLKFYALERIDMLGTERQKMVVFDYYESETGTGREKKVSAVLHEPDPQQSCSISEDSLITLSLAMCCSNVAN